MMIDTKEMFKCYVAGLKNNIVNSKQTIENCELNVKNSTKKLVELKHFIEKELEISFDVILSNTSKIALSNTLKSKKRAMRFAFNQKVDYVKLHSNIIAENNYIIKQLKESAADSKKSVIKFKLYKFIVNLFNESICDYIIKEGYTLRMGHNLGNIYIARKLRSQQRPIDWGASNKIKASIIADGKVPYNKETAPEGEKYIVYHDSKYANYWFWTKFACAVKNRDFFSFNPTKGDFGNVKKLHKYANNNPSVNVKYKLKHHVKISNDF